MRDVIKAIGRGFETGHALKLLNDTYELLVIDLDEVKVRKSQQERVKSRVIGEKGKAKSTIETLTSSDISVYGDTVSAIVPVAHYENLKNALMMLINGSRHNTVYSFLEKKRGEARLDFDHYDTL